jgi:predicted transcriptional regulator
MVFNTLISSFGYERSHMIYRNRLDIIRQILEAANGGMTKTKIMYTALISYDQMKENLKALTEKDLLRYNEDTRMYNTTEKGLRFLDIYNQISDMIRAPLSQPQQQQ